MPNFVLLLYDTHEGVNYFTSLSPEEIQQAIAKYKAWSERLARQGRLVGGHKLRDHEGRVMRANGSGTHVTDGPYAESKDLVGGLYIISADNYQHAVELCRDSPHLEHGTIEIREIQAT